MIRTRSTWLAAALAMLVLLGPAPAIADDRAAALAEYAQAQRLAGEKRWAEAAEHLAASIKLHRSAGTFYGLGVAQTELGKLVEARESFLAFLAEPATTNSVKLESDARARLAALDRRVASMVVVLEPAAIAQPAVEIDGVRVPTANVRQTLLMNPGAHEVVARAPGRTEARTRVSLPEGGSATVTLSLAEIPAAAPAPTTTPPATPPDRGNRTLSIALLGSGAAVFAAGLTLGVVGLVQARDAPTSDGPDARAAHGKAVAGDVVATVGIVAAGVGLVLFLLDRPPARGVPAADPAALLTGTPDRGGSAGKLRTPTLVPGGAGLSWRF